MTEEKKNDKPISEEVVYDDIIEKTFDKVMDRTGIYVDGDEKQSLLNRVKKEVLGYESKVIELPGKCGRENKKSLQYSNYCRLKFNYFHYFFVHLSLLYSETCKK